jgi:A/G-specific adenine glycosylase
MEPPGIEGYLPRMSRRELPWNAQEIRSIRSGLLDFFDEHRRPLPWRSEDPDPWAVLVSEVMSQQTRIETVVPYYLRWMERFPDPGALAAAAEEEVLSLWAGLGYYSRARHLRGAAREIEARYGGRVPSDPDELTTLPGVGPYTAGAVASIAHGVPAPAVDGNVRRVLARLLDDARPSAVRLSEWAGALVDPERPGDFNQALMELGATVCTPRSPACGECPVAGFCGAREAGTVAERPAPRKRGPVADLQEGVLVLVRGEGSGAELLMRRRPPDGLLAGMWEFPGVEPEGGETPAEAAARLRLEAADGAGSRGAACDGAGSRGAASDGAGSAAPRPPDGLVPLPIVRHAYSHRVVRYHPFLGRWERGGSENGVGGLGRWVGRAETERLPLPVVQRTILREAEGRFDASPPD